MTWYRVLLEASGRYRGAEPSSDHPGLFTTRNLEASDETAARQAAIQRLRAELADLEREGSRRSAITVMAIRPLAGPVDPGTGFTFHNDRGDARESARSLEQSVFDRDPRWHAWGFVRRFVMAVRRLTRR